MEEKWQYIRTLARAQATSYDSKGRIISLSSDDMIDQYLQVIFINYWIEHVFDGIYEDYLNIIEDETHFFRLKN